MKDGRTPLLQNESAAETSVPPTHEHTHAPHYYQNAPPAEHYYPYANQRNYAGPSYTTNVSGRAENQSQFSHVQPKDYFPLSVFVTLFCCFPFGLVAILMSIQVRNRFKNNDYEGALKASQAAKILSLLAILFGTISITGIVAAVIVTSISATVHPEPSDYSSLYE